MGAALSLPTTLLNLLLPFTNKSTPLAQDLIHTAILCGTLYFAPQIAEYYNRRTHHNDTAHPPHQIPNPPAPEDSNANIPLDERLVLQEDDDAEEGHEPPPLAPTPPPEGERPAAPEAWQREDDIPQHEDGAPAGPAQPNNGPRTTPQNRTIGAKKAKSLARKDQRRAYHEFHRQAAEERRLREQEGKEEREAVLAAEKARRLEAERVIQERERLEREKKKEGERLEAEEERARRERLLQRVRSEVETTGMVDLAAVASAEGKDRVSVEKLVRASGLIGQLEKLGTHRGEETVVMMTGGGWLVSVDTEMMRGVYEAAARYGEGNSGTVDFVEVGRILEQAVRARAKA